MDRNREARRGTMAATSNGLSRRRQRNSSLRDSPEDEGAVEAQETARLRDRAIKKERERDRDRSSRSKRRRGDRINREEGEESSEESVDEEEEEEEDEAAFRLPPSNPLSSSSQVNHQRKSFPAKIVRAPAAWKVSVPRKARSGSVKRSHECWISGGVGGGGGGEQILRQASTSPARPSPAAAPISPSSSNTSVRKKMKLIGNKHRPPKISKTSSSSIQEIEIEVAEVLYGLTRQFQSPSKQEIITNSPQKLDSKDMNRSRVSSPISISVSPSAVPQMPSLLPQNSSSTITPSPAIAPKRKRPRPVKSERESSANFSVADASGPSAKKIEVEQLAKAEISSPNREKTAASAVENEGSINSEPQQESAKSESNPVPDSKPLEELDGHDGIQAKEESGSALKEAPCEKLDVDLGDTTTTKAESTASVVENRREEKFKIDLMAPPSGKSSPERDGSPEIVTDQKPEVKMVPKIEIVKGEEEKEEFGKQEVGEVRLEQKTEKAADEITLQKQVIKDRILVKESTLDLQLDVEMQDKECGGGKQQVPKQLSKTTKNETEAEKAVQSASLPLPLTVPCWPGGLSPLGYMGQVPSLQSVVSMDGSTRSSTALQPPHFVLPQSRPKRCATHFYIAQNIYCQQQFARMNPFWHPAAGSAPLYGTKPYNLNAVPPTESTMVSNQFQGSFAGRNLNSLQDKAPVHTFAGPLLGQQNSAATFMDATQKQLMLQQAPQPPSANNMLPAPAFIFPVHHQQAAAGAAKSAKAIGNSAPSTTTANSVAGAMASSGSSTATNMSFNYANLPSNEAQYLAIMQNNGYPFPIPAHVGAPPPYRGGSHPQAMPFFNGPFYSSQMLHPSQLQQQQPQTHQNPSTSSGSSSSQKHQQQRLQGSGSNGGGGGAGSHNFAVSKNRQPQPNQQNQHLPGTEDSPSSADGRVTHAQKGTIYNHNFAMPIHPQNFALMSPAALGAGNHIEKQLQPQGLKGGMELSHSQAFAMSFASFNGTTGAPPGLEFSSMGPNHAVFQTLPEPARHGYQMAATSQPAQQKKPHKIMDEGKNVNDSITPNASGEDERKMMAGKGPAIGPHSLTYSVSTIMGNSNIDSSTRALNLAPAPVNGNRASRSTSVTPSTTTTTPSLNTPNSLHQQQQVIHLQKQQQQQLQQQFQQQIAARTKSGSTNSNVYSQFSNNVSVFPQALIQGNSPNQSPQWKNSARTLPTPSLPSSASTSSVKNQTQQQVRTQPGLPTTSQTQISFGMNPKSVPPGQQNPPNNPTPPSSSSPIVGSPPNSISKCSGGSPRTSSGSKPGQTATTLPSSQSQPAKNSQTSSSRKSSPQQQQQQQQQKQPFQQAQLFFSNAYMQAQSPQSTTSSTGYYQRRHPEQQPHQNQQNSSSTGMMSLSSQSLALTATTTSDPAKAVAAANNMKEMPPPGLLHAAQFAAQSAGNPHHLMSSFPYIHTMPLKSTEQKPSAGNDNLHGCWQPEKR
ncbi:protein TIME FOR COFFEE-like isoform X2 [Tasmannia lanceolata]|uniref:protein TIME FOR COFFEE-like isoform X2 n=1 Tax=Tasmannia lanceolata TaxID=3420 RepID=UPI004063B2B9